MKLHIRKRRYSRDSCKILGDLDVSWPRGLTWDPNIWFWNTQAHLTAGSESLKFLKATWMARLRPCKFGPVVLFALLLSIVNTLVILVYLGKKNYVFFVNIVKFLTLLPFVLIQFPTQLIWEIEILPQNELIFHGDTVVLAVVWFGFNPRLGRGFKIFWVSRRCFSKQRHFLLHAVLIINYEVTDSCQLCSESKRAIKNWKTVMLLRTARCF
jgi:hypothetical protein